MNKMRVYDINHILYCYGYSILFRLIIDLSVKKLPRRTNSYSFIFMIVERITFFIIIKYYYCHRRNI